MDPPQNEFYSGGYVNQGYVGQSQGYDMGAMAMDQQDFPTDPQFQQFDYSQQGDFNTGETSQYPAGETSQYPAGETSQYPAGETSQYPAGGIASAGYGSGQASPYMGSIMTPDPVAPYNAEAGAEDYENEPPLIEELGINFDHIKQKTLAVLNPIKDPDASIMQDTDMAGPLVFCFIFGGSLLMAGKVFFGYIYGIGVIGCLAMYALLNLMSMTGVSISCVVSVLGYCLLPMCLLSVSGIILSLHGMIGIVLTSLSVMWCSVSASKLFVSALSMDQQQLLVAYPCALVYGVFALIAVF